MAALVVFGLAVRHSAVASARRVGHAGLVAAPVLAAVGLAIPVAGDWRGLLQRLLDVGLYAWILAVAHRWSRHHRVGDVAPIAPGSPPT